MGSFGGIRSSTILRPFVSELGLISVPKYAVIPEVHNAFDPEGKTSNPRIITSIKQVIEEVEWYAHAVKNHKHHHPVPGSE